MAALSARSESATLIAFPRAPRGQAAAAVAAALKTHRLPEHLTAQLLRAAGDGCDPRTALTGALEARMRIRPLDLQRARAILLVGAKGAGKSTVAAAIAEAARPREAILHTAKDGLARLRADGWREETLLVMEADGFHPLNPKARGAFAALNDIVDVETVGVVSAADDAEDVAETIAAFRFRRVIVTGLDRTRRLGALAAAATSGAALAHVTEGAALRALDAAELARRLLMPRLHPSPD